MKKNVLLSLFTVFVVFAFGQSKFGEVEGPYKDLRLKHVQVHPDQKINNTGEFVNLKSLDVNTIGTTVYDAQALNWGNMTQRMWAYDDGTIGATWTSMGFDNLPERGCGYNYFDGSVWGEPIPHVGAPDRLGPPSYAPWGPNGEIVSVYRYIPGEGPMLFYKRETKGEGEWEEVELVGPTGVSLVWQAMMTSGEENEFIHLLAYTYDDPYMGQESALLYYRSSDGCESWDIEAQVIDGLGDDYFASINSFSYAWANPVGDKIAFTYGFDEFGGQIFKSDDNGDSWDIIDVFTTPFSGIDPPTESTIFPCGVGSSAISLDSDGMAHVVFPRMRKKFVDDEAGWYPYTDGLIYWNETMEVLDTTTISSYTLEYLDEGGYLIGWLPESLVIPENQPNYANALWGFPQISIDAQNNLFVATSTVTDYEFGDQNYRHIFVNSSFDGGASWEGQVDLNDELIYMFSECAFPAMAPVIDDKVYIVYQEDVLPGFHEWLDNHEQIENQMVALTFDKDFFVGVSERLEKSAVKLSEGYPNPSQYNVSFALKLDEGAAVNINITNIVGQVVKSINKGQLQSGLNSLTIDVSDFAPGTYFCTVKVNKQSFSRKIVVTR